MLFRAFKSDSTLISVSFALFSLDLSTSLFHSNSFHVKITSDFEFDLISSVSSSLRLSSLSSQSCTSFSSFFVASDSESMIKKMMIISCDLSFDSAQNQMFLEFKEYIEKKLRFLVLNIEINRNDISEMKKNVEDATINCREMQEQMTTQETWINDLLCWIARQNKIIEDLWKQIEKYDNFQLILITQTQNALTLLAMHSKDQNVSVAIKICSSVMSSSFLFSLLSHVSLSSFSFDLFLSMTSSLLLSSTSITQSIIEEMKNVSFSSDSFSSMTSSLFSSLTSITQSIIEEMKNAVSFDMSFLFHSFCQYDSLCMFCAIWLIVARVYFHQLSNFRESENWMIHVSYETHKLFMYQFLHLLMTFLDCWFEYWREWLSKKVLFFFSFFLSNDS